MEKGIQLANRIFVIRGQKVMLDFHLAELYEVPAKRLNEQVKRNIERFPGDFMFQLTSTEADNLRSQIATSSLGYGGRRYIPYAFTEHGISMLSSVLRSPRAIQMNIFIIRAFVRMRELLAVEESLVHRVESLEHRQSDQEDALLHISSIIVRITDEPAKQIGKIGFDTE